MGFLPGDLPGIEPVSPVGVTVVTEDERQVGDSQILPFHVTRQEFIDQAPHLEQKGNIYVHF